MALHTFDKRLLEFMYQLTLHQKLMAPKEMSQVITIQGKKVSERTIKRWLKWLKAHHYFTYYPHIITERIGLVKTVVFVSDLKNPKILDLIPYKTYLMSGASLRELKNTFVVHYAIPEKHLDEFKNFWRKALDAKLIGNYELLKLRCSNILYTPLHLAVEEDGRVDFSKKSRDASEIKIPDSKILNAEIHSKIKENPFLVPLLIEHYKAHASSKKIWFSMKQKLSESIWDYIKDIKIKNKKNDGQGICLVRDTLNYLHKNFDMFFQQIRVSYGPLYVDDNISFCGVLELRNENEIKELFKKLLKNSLFIAYNESASGKKELLFEITTNMSGMTEIFNMLSDLCNVKRISKLVLFNYTKSSEYWENKTKGWLKQHYHELFDPKTVSWRYDSKKYLQELKPLSASGE
jgi:hypothetical protein